MRRIFSFILSVILLCSMAVNVRGAEIQKENTGEKEGKYTYKVLSDGTVKITDYRGSENELTIPDKIKGKKVTVIGKKAFADNRYIDALVLPKYLREIEDRAFESCSYLFKIIIPDRKIKFRKYAFLGCEDLDQVHISNIRKWCESSFENKYSNPLTRAEDIFYNGEVVENLVIPDGTSKISGMAFQNAKCLESVTIPDSVEKIGYISFAYCENLKEVKGGAGVKLIGKNAFYSCYELKDIILSKNLEEIKERAFMHCESLGSVEIPHKVKAIEPFAFYHCKKLTWVKLPDDIQRIDDYAFSGCKNLETINFPDHMEYVGLYAMQSTMWVKNQPNGMIYIANTAYRLKGECPEEIVIKNGTKALAGNLFVAVTYDVKKVVLPETIERIGQWAFSNCSNLESVNIPDSVTTIENNAFFNCKKLTEISLGKNVRNLQTSIFQGCKNLEKVTLNDKLEYIGSFMFSDCKNLESINIPKSVTTIRKGGFYNCDALTEVPYGENLTEYESIAFGDCDGFEKIVIPENVKKIGSFAFSGCLNAETLTIPKSVKKINGWAFSDCVNLEKVDYFAKNCKFSYTPSGSQKAVENDNRVFQYCQNLNKVVIGDTVEKLPVDFFKDILQKSLREIKICNDIKKVNYKVFDTTKKVAAKKGSYNNVVKVNSNSDVSVTGYGKANVKFKCDKTVVKVKFEVIPRRVKTKNIVVAKSGNNAVIKLKDTRNLKFTAKISTDENFEKSTNLACKNRTFKIKNMKKGKKYYFRVRAYKIVKGKKIVSNHKTIVIS